MSLYTVSGLLTPVAPFDFSHTLAFLGNFTPTQGEQKLADLSLTKAVFVNGQVMVFRVKSVGSVEAPQLEYTLFSEQAITPSVKEATSDRISFFLSLGDDLKPFYALAKDDPRFAPIAQKLYGYHQVRFLTPFENACWAILTQRTPMTMAHRIKQRIIEKCGSSLEVEGEKYTAFPEAVHLAALSPDELATLIKNAQKIEYMAAVIEAFSEVDENFLRMGDYDKVEAWLRSIKGIGEWSASFIMLRGLGRTEKVPVMEERLADVVSKLYGKGETLPPKIIKEIASKYGVYQGYWGHYLRVGFN